MTPPNNNSALRAEDAFDEVDNQPTVLDTDQGSAPPAMAPLHAVRDEELESANEMSDASELDELIEERTAPVAPTVVKSGGGKFLGGTALVVGLLAAAGAGAAYMQQQQFQSDVAIAFEEVDSNIAKAFQSANDMGVTLTQLETKVSENRIDIAGIDTKSLQNQITDLQTDLISAANALKVQRGLSERSDESIRATLSEVETRLTLDIASLSKTAAGAQLKDREAQQQVNQAALASKPIAKPTGPRTVTSIDGNNFINVDYWGNEQQAVMQKGGEYTYLAKGDALGKWTVKSIDEDKSRVIFTDGKQTMIVKQL